MNSEASHEFDAQQGVAAGWEQARGSLQAEFPKAKEGILFCVWKLRQDPNLTLRDFRDEAQLRNVSLGGRSLHSAKVLLGWEEPSKRRPNGSRPAPVVSKAPATRSGDAIEQQLLDNVRRIQEIADADATRLRAAIREAIAVLERALD